MSKSVSAAERARREAVARRLEFVRREWGPNELSYRQFWRQLIDGDGYDISYQAVQNYHFVGPQSRDQPSSYIARVAEVFGINPTWLLTGLGEPSLTGEAHIYLLGESEQEDPWTEHLWMAWNAQLQGCGLNAAMLPGNVWSGFRELAETLALAWRPGDDLRAWDEAEVEGLAAHLFDGLKECASKVVGHGGPVFVRAPIPNVRVALTLTFEAMRLLIGGTPREDRS